MRVYPVTYTDRFGEEKARIFSDGSTLFFTIRDTQFEGSDFEMLTREEVDHSKFDFEEFADGSGDLTNFRMEITFPIIITHNNSETNELLTCFIDVGDTSSLNSILNTIILHTSFGKFTSNQKIEWFEDSILEIQRQLPQKTNIKNCLSCKHSHYHPVGSSMFGSLHCFQQIAPTNITSKDTLFDVWTEEAIENNQIFNVQETFDCEYHQFITPDDWVYKNWEE